MSEEATYSTGEIRTIALAVIAGVFFGGVATGVAFPTLPLLDEKLVISAVMLSIILSANRIGRLFMNTPAGTIIDQYGARTPMIFGLFTQALAPFGYIVGLHTPPTHLGTLPLLGDVSLPGLVFVLARLFWGVGSAFVFIGAFATITYVTTADNRGRWVGYMRGGQSLGFPTGLVLGGLLTDLASMQTAFLTAGVLALVAGTVATLVLPDVHGGADEGRAAKLREVPALLAANPTVVLIGYGNFAVRFLWGGIILSTLARYASDYGLELSALGAAGISGIVMGLGVITSGSMTIVTGWLSDMVSDRTLLTVPAFLAMGAGFLVIAYVPTIEALLGAIVLVGAGMGAAAPALLAIMGDLTPGDELGRMGGVYQVMGDVGLSLGPLVAIPAVDLWFGYQLTYVLCAALVLSCLTIVSLPLLRNPEVTRTGVKAD
ncbi:major facilitator superfamily protein [Natrinema pellirubrum DSM 15624]|uniref:Major facilitator superfamily protein n=1 Tax=Natrinema pellirubrum (strain DSM 15624 / CIP 106293 / JCM 10476 / NCIMB 786 / 157) TaxID=797303 RepID=L0JQ44_NATP1|nr:MFS transporter [Natrinema pellirubrum]AGB33329.1 sugar phosphate permease [Natrinema pellirubrum DSM 15624]ELY71453.1 major facilitator superfamily protein [Natrinema pellirubrum DSM 15624]